MLVSHGGSNIAMEEWLAVYDRDGGMRALGGEVNLVCMEVRHWIMMS